MDEEKVYYTIILRHDTSTNWMMNNPILALSEYGVEDDTHRVKRGNGQSNWADLPYEHFGLEYLVTFEGLLGEVNDSQALKEAFNEKVDKSIFSDNANGLIENITLTAEDGAIGKITRLTKDVTTGAARASYLIIKSDDNSLQGVYTINDEGIRVLNVRAYSHINDYEAGKIYHINELCYYDNRLYRAVDEEFIAEPAFTKAHWVLLASLHSSDIKYNHLTSGLEADNVKSAIDELADLDSEKVKKTSRENKVYGTNEYGEQYLYNKDDLRKLDTVNHKQADLNKNVQIDASDINYTDSDPSKGTVRQILDSKVDKKVAGEGARIVRDVQFEYNETTGHITMIEDKVSLEDGTSAEERRNIDVVSEQELANEVQTLNNTINTKETEIYNVINTKETEVYNTINSKETALYDTINTKETELYDTINTKEDAIYNKILEEHNEINDKADRIESESQTRDTALGTRIDNATIDYNTKINNAVNTLNNNMLRHVDIINERIDTEVETLNNTITTKETAIYNRITDEHDEINARVDQEVQTLNNTIDTLDTDTNDRIDQEVATLNARIDTEKTAMDNKKINKSIAPGLVSEIVAATESNEPTLKITTKNTTTETPTISHLHFKAQGQIQTRFQDADHIVIDSTNIDDKNAQQDTRLTNAETRILANEDNITALQTHDASHDSTLALHAQQIADNTHDIQDLQAEMTDAQYDIGRLQTQNATQETHLTNLDELVQANADDIVVANQNISRNLASITDLQNNKANKTFANLTNNKVVGTLNTQELQNNEIIKLGIKSIDPSTETASDSILKVISSDNTIIATRDQDTGVIDLKANLDTDVNYFVTTEILNTTIPSENIIPLNTLTPTDKVNVEVHDIISDPEGTWARVESINDTLQTCIAVTFKKHAQAVWGTIKGDIADQQDLQEQFADLETQLSGDITAEENARIAADNNLQDNIDTLQDNIDTVSDELVQEIQNRTTADQALETNKLNKTGLDNENRLAGDVVKTMSWSGQSGRPYLYNGVSIYRQSLHYDLENSEWITQDYNNSPAFCQLTSIGSIDKALTFTINDVSAATAFPSSAHIGVEIVPEEINFDAKSTGLSSTKLPSAVREVKGIVDTKVTLTNEINKVYGTDANGDQIVYDKSSFGKVDTVNNTQADANKNVQLDASKINLDDTAQTTETLQSIITNLIADLQTQISAYTQNTSYIAIGTYTTQKYVTFENDQNVLLMAKILKDFTSDNTQSTVYESFMKDVENGNIKLVGIQEQVDPTPGPTPPTPDYQEVFNILDDVDGQGDTYDGLGGTEEEVEQVLDDILGN